MAGKTQQLKSVTLTKPHQHAGVKYSAGDVISVDAATAAWLKQNGITGNGDTATEEAKTE